MDKLAFGLDRPKLAVMKDGGVFVAGKPIITAVAGTPAAGVQEKGSKSVRSAIAPQAATGLGGLLEAVFGTLSAVTLEVDYVTMNQGVEKYLNAENTMDGKPETNSRLQWKKDVPGIAFRPTKVEFFFKSNRPLENNLMNNLKARVSLINPMGEYVSPQDIRLNRVGSSSQFNFQGEAIFTDQQSLPDGKIKVIIDPSGKIIPSVKPLDDRAQIINPSWKLSDPITVYVFPIQYVYWDKDASGNMVSGTSQLTGSNWTDYVGRFKNYVKSMFPVSWDNPGEETRVRIVPVPMSDLPLVWNEDPRAAGTLNNDPTASNYDRLVYTTLANGTLQIKPRWQTMIDLMTPRIQDKYRIDRDEYRPKNTYFVGVFPSVNRHSTISGMALVQGATRSDDRSSIDPWQNRHFTAVHSDMDFWSVHELGHQLGAQHAPFGASTGVDRDWPMLPGSPWAGGPVAAYALGAIGAPGWNPLSQTAIDKSTKDLMAYTMLPQWASDFFFAMWYKHQQNPATPGPRPFAY